MNTMSPPTATYAYDHATGMYWLMPASSVGQQFTQFRPTQTDKDESAAVLLAHSAALAVGMLSWATLGGLGALTGWLIGGTKTAALIGAGLGIAATPATSYVAGWLTTYQLEHSA